VVGRRNKEAAGRITGYSWTFHELRGI